MALPACFSLSPSLMWASTPHARATSAQLSFRTRPGQAARQLSLVRLKIRLVQHFGDHETQDSITEEFEPLVGFAMFSRGGADMGKGRRDQLAIGENMADALLEQL